MVNMPLELLKLYFHLGLHYKEIVWILAHNHGIIISLRHLKRKLRELGLYRRKQWTNYCEVVAFLKKELQASGQLHGYRMMHAKCISNGLEVRKEDVRLILSLLDPAGVQSRQRGRLRRRAYYAKGPNYIWHIDGYDKLKPFGFCISGCIDGYSRNIIWLCAYYTNNDPKVIGGYFMEAVTKFGGCPTLLRGDLGTENCIVKDFQKFLRRNRETDEPTEHAYLEGKSVHNQRIEQWWGHLRKECLDFWIVLFKRLKNDGHFSGNFLDTNVLQFCFMSIIQVC